MSFYCIKCKNTITDDEYHYSFKNFGKPLCRSHQPTPEARKLGGKLEQLGNWKVDFEYFDGHKNIDIRLPGPKVDIEVDGLQHTTTKEQALRDIKREYFSYKNGGFITLHVPNILVRDDPTIDQAASFINEFLKESYKDVQGFSLIDFIKKLFKK